MAGADVFTLDPEPVHEAVAKLFDVEGAIRGDSTTLEEEAATAAGPLAEANLAIGEALVAAANFFCGVRAAGTASLIGNLGEYLATCAEQAVEIDDYNASDFASLADHDRYPGRASENASARGDW